MQQQLEISAKQQNFQQAGTIRIGHALVAKAYNESSVRALLQNFTDGSDLGCIERPASNHRLNRVQPFVKARKEMIEAEILPRKGDHR